MAGPQHSFPANFGGAPQNDMRSQFGGPRTGQIPGISSPGQQVGIASPQTYNVGVNIQQLADSPISAQQMQQSAQQTSQQLQMQMQQRQQIPSQQQQQESVQQAQQAASVQAQAQQQTIPQPQQNVFPPQSSLPQHSAVQNTGGGPNMGVRMTPGDGSIQSVTQSNIQSDNTGASSAGASGPVQQQPPASQQFNTASLCKYGQEIVQDIVCKVQDIFQILRSIMPPNGAPGPTATISNEKKLKLQEYLRGIKGLLKRLRLIYDKCNDNSQLGTEYMHIESLIPLKDPGDVKTFEERKTSEAYRLATEECKDLVELVVLKNCQLKEIIDHMRKIVWEINTMLTMRKS